MLLKDGETEETTADERVYRAIYDAVQTRRLGPGVKLKEVELTQLFKVSRGSVRSALLRLASKGLVEMAPSRGAMVTRLTPDDCAQLFTARRAIECVLVETLARTATPDIVARLRRHVAAQDEAFRTGLKEEGHRLALGFHRLIAELAGNKMLAKFVDDLLARMPLVILTLGATHADQASEGEHLELVDAIAAGDAARARTLMDHHLRHVESALEATRTSRGATLADMLAPVRPEKAA